MSYRPEKQSTRRKSRIPDMHSYTRLLFSLFIEIGNAANNSWACGCSIHLWALGKSTDRGIFQRIRHLFWACHKC